MTSIMYSTPATYPMPTVERYAWQAEAACVGRDPEWWFPKRGDRQSLEAARVICKSCPVVAECGRTFKDEEHGVFGAMSGYERKHQERPPGPKTPRPTCASAEGCERPQKAHGLCAAHYERTRRTLPRKCRRGHEYTPENTRITPSTGKRYCLACKNAPKSARRPRTVRYTREDVKRMEALRSEGKTHKEIGAEYGCAPSYVSMLVAGKRGAST